MCVRMSSAWIGVVGVYAWHVVHVDKSNEIDSNGDREMESLSQTVEVCIPTLAYRKRFTRHLTRKMVLR